jgi:hypothetical protein
MKTRRNRGLNKRNRKTKNKSKSRRIRGGQYRSNVGYSSGYSLPFFTKTVTNIV